jgi:putative heme-binding domain-containing protein
MSRSIRRSTKICRARKIAARGLAVALGSALLISAQNPALDGHPQDYARADIEYGAKLYAQYCDRCHGANGTGVGGVDLRSGKFRNAVVDAQVKNVIMSGFPTAGMPAFHLDDADLTGLVAYLRNMNSIDRGSLKPGDAARGKLVFEGRGACLSCHRVGEKGSRKAPDLSDIGAIRGAGTLERSLTDPSAQMMPINRPVHIVTKGGSAIDGRRLNEDTYTVQIADENGQLLSLAKEDLREFKVDTKSPMPSYKGELTASELSDLVAYLLTLKGQ